MKKDDIIRERLNKTAIRLLQYRNNSLNELLVKGKVCKTVIRKPLNPHEGDASVESLRKIIRGLTEDIQEIAREIRVSEKLALLELTVKDISVVQAKVADLQESESEVLLDLSFKINDKQYVMITKGACLVNEKSVSKETIDTPRFVESDYTIDVSIIHLYEDDAEILDYDSVICKEWVEDLVNEYCID